jgi:hypothetical protein
VLLDEPELHLGDDILVPDLADWRRERMPEIPDAPYFELAPDWVCEVLSPSTYAKDRGRKLPIYAREGVQHAWLMEPKARLLEVLVLDGNSSTRDRALRGAEAAGGADAQQGVGACRSGCSSLAMVVTMRAPVAPNGWPMATEPPCTLSLAGSTSPTALSRPSRAGEGLAAEHLEHAEHLGGEGLVHVHEIHVGQLQAGPLERRGIARAGPMSSWSAGSTPT